MPIWEFSTLSVLFVHSKSWIFSARGKSISFCSPKTHGIVVVDLFLRDDVERLFFLVVVLVESIGRGGSSAPSVEADVEVRLVALGVSRQGLVVRSDVILLTATPRGSVRGRAAASRAVRSCFVQICVKNSIIFSDQFFDVNRCPALKL